MANTFKFGNGNWASKKEAVLAYNDENNNFKPLPFTFDRASSATVVNKQGLIETVGTDEPRIDFLNNSKGHLLLEPERRNVVQYSEDTTTWGKNQTPVVTLNNGIAPDGTQSSDKVIVNSISEGFYDFSTGTVTSGTIYTTSIFIKHISGVQTIRFGFAGTGFGGDNDNVFNIVNGTIVSSVANSTNQIINYGNGWFRLICTKAATATNTGGFILYGNVNAEIQYNVWGAQLEQGSYATSYIPTQGETNGVTRSLETMPTLLDITPLNIGNSYTLFLDANLNVNESNKVFLQLITSSSQTSFTVRNNIGGVRAYNQIDGNYPVGNRISSNNKFVIRVDGNSYKIFTQGTSLSGTLTTQRDLGYLNFIGNNTELKINNFTIDNTALSDAECQALTS